MPSRSRSPSCCSTVSRTAIRFVLGSHFLTLLLASESDARYGSFDFRAAHAEAEAADLKDLLDNNESLVRWPHLMSLSPSLALSPLSPLSRSRSLSLSLSLSHELVHFLSLLGGEGTSATGCLGR